MVQWEVVVATADPHVLVQFLARDGDRWGRFSAAACGVVPAARVGAAVEACGALEDEKPARTRRLSLVEAFHALAVERLLEAPLGVEHYWRWFATLSADFETQFAIYQHFRRLGWHIQSGLNYGAHFVLYRGSAAAFHSEYIVYVQAAGASWNVVQALTRVAADVRKTVLLCEVTASPTPPELSSAREDAPSLSHGSYELHGRWYTVDAVAVRFWDVGDARLHAAEASVDAFAFQPQSMLPKRGPSKAVPKRRQDKAPSSAAKKKTHGERSATPE